MRRMGSSFAAGTLFAIGLGVSGMTDANKVISFLNLAGDWDPSLAFVMVGGIGVHMMFYRLVMRRPSPLFEASFSVPAQGEISPQLVSGAALFGIGWGMGGFCPGPGLVSSVSLSSPAVVFVVFMSLGMMLHQVVARKPASTTRSA